MIKIRLSKNKTRKKSIFKIVVSDSRSPRDGKFIEKIGYVNLNNKNYLFINNDRINFWIKKGAKLSNRIIFLLKNIKKKEICL